MASCKHGIDRVSPCIGSARFLSNAIVLLSSMHAF